MSFSREEALLLALGVLYLSECVVWLRAGECVLTRAGDGRWREHAARARSFALGGRVPVLVDPVLLRPGVVRVRVGGRVPPAPRMEALGRELDRRWLLTAMCQVQLVLLLVALPCLVLSGWLLRAWPVLLVEAVVLHGAICGLGMRAMRRGSVAEGGGAGASRVGVGAVLALLLNPVGAVRMVDLISERWSEQWTGGEGASEGSEGVGESDGVGEECRDDGDGDGVAGEGA